MVKTGTIAAQQAMAALIGLLIMTSILLRKILPKIQFTLNYYSDNRSVQYASICVSNPNDPCTAAVLVVRASTKPNVSCNGDVINTPDIPSTHSQCMDNDGDIRRFYFPPEPNCSDYSVSHYYEYSTTLAGELYEHLDTKW